MSMTPLYDQLARELGDSPADPPVDRERIYHEPQAGCPWCTARASTRQRVRRHLDKLMDDGYLREQP